jgi:hypothetical protein
MTSRHDASSYRPVRHARVAPDAVPPETVAWVLIAHWTYPDGTEDWCLEYLDRNAETIDDDTYHDSEPSAAAHAESRYGADVWHPGVPPRESA